MTNTSSGPLATGVGSDLTPPPHSNQTVVDHGAASEGTPPKSAAFFDLDRTVIAGSSIAQLGYAAWRSGLIELDDVWMELLSGVVFRWRGEVSTDANDALHRALGLISGRKRSELDQLADPLIKKLLSQVQVEAAQFLRIHQQAGRDCYLVSASAIEIVERMAAELGCSGAIATEVEVIDGTFTGRLAKPFLHGPEKAKAVAALAREENYDLSRSFAYGDSIGDLPMLDLVGSPVAVNPDSALTAAAKERGWPIVHCAKTRDPTIRRVGAGAAVAAAAAGGVALSRLYSARAKS